MGHTPKLDQDEPEVVAKITHIRETAHAAGIKVGIHCMSPTYARKMVEEGMDLVTIASDMRILAAGYASMFSEYKG